jgi:hypothetical protein
MKTKASIDYKKFGGVGCKTEDDCITPAWCRAKEGCPKTELRAIEDEDWSLIDGRALSELAQRLSALILAERVLPAKDRNETPGLRAALRQVKEMDATA